LSDDQGKGRVARILQQANYSRADLLCLLATEDTFEIEQIRRAAEATLLKHCGSSVRLRGLIEFSNRCVCNCLYCGIRAGHRSQQRYTLRDEEIVACARWSAEQGYGSIVLQSGERRDRRFIDRLVNNLCSIKQATRSQSMPDGVGITLCVGEQSHADYQRLYDAGAHRYLLRMETSSRDLFSRLHPATQSYDQRLACLGMLKDIGYQVGTGVMIGIPGQTLEQLVDDLLFFQSLDIDMIGMGPYIPHEAAAMPATPEVPAVERRLALAYRMIALARLLLRDVNIAATTALQALDPHGRERGLSFGANVIMPQVTPLHVRTLYTLYDGKPCLGDSATQCASCLEQRVQSVGRQVLHDGWGDSAHFSRRNHLPLPEVKKMTSAGGGRRVIPLVLKP
jgi:biotin synthase